jgi:hypothetical protein
LKLLTWLERPAQSRLRKLIDEFNQLQHMAKTSPPRIPVAGGGDTQGVVTEIGNATIPANISEILSRVVASTFDDGGGLFVEKVSFHFCVCRARVVPAHWAPDPMFPVTINQLVAAQRTTARADWGTNGGGYAF